MRTLALLVAIGFAAPALAFLADEKKLDDAKCPVSGAEVNPEQKVEYKKAEVYFCCERCPGAFKANIDKFTEKANAQLVVTGQAEQTACPLSGRPVDESKATEVAGAKVAFCCGNCLGKVEGSEDDEKVTLIFSADAFEKGFEVKEKE